MILIKTAVTLCLYMFACLTDRSVELFGWLAIFVLEIIIMVTFLAVKECFFEDEIRCILIKKSKNGRKVKYHNRSCSNVAAGTKILYLGR